MNVHCDQCGYNSGDHDSNAELAAKVNADGGEMMMRYDEFGKPEGWEIACPNGHNTEEIHLD